MKSRRGGPLCGQASKGAPRPRRQDEQQELHDLANPNTATPHFTESMSRSCGPDSPVAQAALLAAPRVIAQVLPQAQLGACRQRVPPIGSITCPCLQTACTVACNGRCKATAAG